MNRVSISKISKEKVTKEQPNWNIQALYNDRQLIRDKKLTKFFIPYDSSDPDDSWRFFFFGEDGSEQNLEISKPTTLIGREKFCDIVLQNKTVSRQHCAIQFRSVRVGENDPKIVVKPYIFDISSKGGTFINEEMVPPMCFVELKHTDTLSFAKSTENIVLMQSIVEKEINYDE